MPSKIDESLRVTGGGDFSGGSSSMMPRSWMAHRMVVWLVWLPVALSVATAAPAPLNPPRTPWGDPDLEGVWTYGTMTPLERPRELADQAVLSETDATAYEQRTIERQNKNAFITAGPDWWDPANSRLADRRTSLIVTPTDG